MFMNQRSIPCNCDPLSLVLTPSMGFDQSLGGVNAVINFQNDPVCGRTGTVSYAGAVKAFLTFGDDGSLIGYTLTDDNASTSASVANILAAM